jgi:hypothetical protein
MKLTSRHGDRASSTRPILIKKVCWCRGSKGRKCQECHGTVALPDIAYPPKGPRK